MTGRWSWLACASSFPSCALQVYCFTLAPWQLQGEALRHLQDECLALQAARRLDQEELDRLRSAHAAERAEAARRVGMAYAAVAYQAKRVSDLTAAQHKWFGGGEAARAEAEAA